jgi:hypothetical protein
MYVSLPMNGTLRVDGSRPFRKGREEDGARQLYGAFGAAFPCVRGSVPRRVPVGMGWHCGHQKVTRASGPWACFSIGQAQRRHGLPARP